MEKDYEKLTLLPNLIFQASAKSILTLSCPYCSGGLSISFAYIKPLRKSIKQMGYLVQCKKCPWDFMGYENGKPPSWVRKLGPTIHTSSKALDKSRAGKKKILTQRTKAEEIPTIICFSGTAPTDNQTKKKKTVARTRRAAR